MEELKSKGKTIVQTMQNVQHIHGPQINIKHVAGNYIHHVENYIAGNFPMPKEEEPAKKKYAVASLFKDEEQDEKEAVRFVKFLKKEGIESVKVDAKVDNIVNRVFVAYYHYWRKKGVLPVQPNAAACFRFLKNNCNRTFEVVDKTYITFIRKMISDTQEEQLADILVKIRRYLA